MMGILVLILTVLWTLGAERYNVYIIVQLVLAIPMLFFSNLAYSKIGYRKNSSFFDRFGWVTSTLGNNFVLNVVALIAASFYPQLGYIYVILLAVGMTIYYILNILSSDNPLRQIIKLILIYAIIIAGAVVPLIYYY
jgi:hypothetical protein